MRKLWRPRGQVPAPEVLNDWAGKLCVSPRLAGLLWNRGLETPDAMDVFLCPGLRHLMRPQEIPGMDAAARAVAQALEAGRKITVWGDYDVDGVTSTALLLDFFAKRGYAAASHIPARMEEGYGLSCAGLERLAGDGTQLVLTVDCGIGAVAEARRARELGLDLVVTDHHLPGPELPDALAVANPKLADGPGRDLAGVGVAFFLAAALNRMLPGEPLDIRQFLDLAAMGTLADVVSLTGQNRILVKNGLLLLAEGARPGVFALKEAAGYYPKAPLEASQVTFGLAPRINAAGRLGHAGDALRLLLASDLRAARPLAKQLDELNVRRRQEEEAISAEALEQARLQAGAPALVLHAPHWHQGVIGIVASRVVENHYRPALVITACDGKLKGSGRSIPEVDLYAALEACGGHLLGFGGHRQAAGLSLAPENLETLGAAFREAVRAQLGETDPVPSLRLDGELSFADIHQELLKELDLLGPFGCGNPEPVFSSPPLDVRGRRTFGANHVVLEVRDPGAGVTLRAKAWRMADKLGPEVQGKPLTLAFTPKLDTYNGLASVELRVKDWAVS
ncbi:Single-stranded-DNA-specific exonuclease RecJ [Fundidesulfovibrio magnetotacticus]|uniref:Single-stranded-DNA-specific exonuclease RecJ n=1 Tax=Fundidesulfovibrio magnetotacticus TaxID=2730080 RepID=A0A6V8LRM0_9BACT|nr:single-stranded-DNA-specific exonuclease RecJ [Fundidesulfovibrio magnetotacticus]GFK92769.1 Single-stranded-DNA-specific exonuclease RecJ [Fundidesulfovibrio magnetotacticus]